MVQVVKLVMYKMISEYDVEKNMMYVVYDEEVAQYVGIRELLNCFYFVLLPVVVQPPLFIIILYIIFFYCTFYLSGNVLYKRKVLFNYI